MASNPKKKTTYDYNIYMIPINRVEDLVDHLLDKRFEEIPLKSPSNEDDSFEYKLFFCNKVKKKGSPWISLLSSCSEWELENHIKVYGAALICKGDTSCYVVSYGNAHFYLTNYCDYNFGIKIAERIIKLDSVKAQQNVSHGGKMSKMHVDYISGSILSYRGGEIPTYIRGESVNEETWGKYINCATSAQFKWEEAPLEIGRKMKKIDEVLANDAIESIPRLIALDSNRDEEKIRELNNKLAHSIDEYEDHAKTDSYVNVPSFYLVGTKIIQNDILRFRLICNRVKKEYEGEISIESIQSYLIETQINVYDDIENIKLSVEYSNDSWTPYKPISEYLEFITDDNFCLRNGKWCLFNSAYISQVLRDVNKIDFENHSDDPWTLNYSDLLAFAKTEGIYIDRDKQPYETYYNHKLNKKLKGKMIHPKTIPIDENEDKRYKYEVCDLEKDGHMYFVKIGQPSNFAYAVDQANLTLTKIVNGNGKIKLPDRDVCEPNCFHLVLVCNNRKTIINNWKDILSINFLIHLSELKYNLNSTNISLKVDFAYNN